MTSVPFLTRNLPDGRELTLIPLIAGGARLSLGHPGDKFVLDVY